MTCRLLTALLIVGSFTSMASAQAPPAPGGDEREMVEKVNKAIDKGVQFLRVNHNPDKQWDAFWLNQLGDMKGGVTAVVALSLLNCGVSPHERELKSALQYLRDVSSERNRSKTYVVGLCTMVFAEARLPQDLPVIQGNVDWLLKHASRSGGRIVGWSYPFDENSRPDGSNTQYALLGLYAGKMAGAKIDDKNWKEIRQLYIDSMAKEGDDAGYWSYIPKMTPSSFTMTVAGVSGLLIADMGLDESQQQLDPLTGVARSCGKYDANDPITRGLNWIGRNFSFDRAKESKSTYYNIYGIERVGRLSGQRFIGRIDWYREGCDYLIRTQNGDGSWTGQGVAGIDGSQAISTAFSLLFLSKGRTPILISKLAYGDFTMPQRGVLAERSDEPGIVGWNRKHSDARHLTEFASREMFGNLPLGWQVYDPRRREFNRDADILAEVGVLVQSPIVYFNGHQRPRLTKQQQELLKRYIEEGGFVFAEACCGSKEFAEGFRDLMQELFPDSKLQPVPPEHALWRSHFAVPPNVFPKLEALDRGCRTVVVFSPEPLAGYWEETRYMVGKEPVGLSSRKVANPGDEDYRGQQAFRLGANVIAYATGKEPPKQRLTERKIVDLAKQDRSPPKGFLKPAQLRIPGEAPPAPAAMRNLMAHLKSAARIDAVLDKESLSASDDELFKFKFVYMHGRKRFNFTDDEIDNLRANLQGGGLLLADACCGKPEFDDSFRAMCKKLFPDSKLEPIPIDDELYSAKLNGTAITSVKRREKSADPADGFRDLPPALEGIKIDGRWVVIYSKYDLGCALEGHKSSDCLGHTRDSALQLASAAVLYALKR